MNWKILTLPEFKKIVYEKNTLELEILSVEIIRYKMRNFSKIILTKELLRKLNAFEKVIIKEINFRKNF